MDFLSKYNISNEEIELIRKTNSEGIINSILINKDNVIEIIDYLVELGVKVEAIKDLFLYQIGLFFRTLKEIKEAFDEYETESIVKSLNYDVNTVDLIEFE